MRADSAIFVAGHNGLVGQAISAQLRAKGYTNIITKSSSELDLRNYDALRTFFTKQNIEFVFVCAAKVGGIVANNTFRADFIYENLCIQNNLIGLSHEFGVKKLLFLGSSCIYPKFAPQPIKEEYLLTSELEYTNEPYAIAKIAGLKLCESFALQYGDNFMSVMPTNLYGNADNFNLYNSHVLPALIRKIHLAKLLAKGSIQALLADTKLSKEESQRFLDEFGISAKSVSIWGDGSPRREFLHVDDMASACVFIIENINFRDLVALSLTNNTESSPKEIKNTHINIGYGEDISIKDLALLVCKIIGFDGELVFDTSKPNGTPQKLMDNTRIKNLGWEPKIDLETGIKRVYEHYLTHANKT